MKIIHWRCSNQLCLLMFSCGVVLLTPQSGLAPNKTAPWLFWRLYCANCARNRSARLAQEAEGAGGRAIAQHGGSKRKKF